MTSSNNSNSSHRRDGNRSSSQRSVDVASRRSSLGDPSPLPPAGSASTSGLTSEASGSASLPGAISQAAAYSRESTLSESSGKSGCNGGLPIVRESAPRQSSSSFQFPSSPATSSTSTLTAASILAPMAAAAIRESSQALSMLEPQFSKRALNLSRDFAGSFIDLALLAASAPSPHFEQQPHFYSLPMPGPIPIGATAIVAPFYSPWQSIFVTAKTRRWMALRHLRYVLVMHVVALVASIACLNVEGRGTRSGGALRRKACQAALVAARSALTALDREVAVGRPELPSPRRRPTALVGADISTPTGTKADDPAFSKESRHSPASTAPIEVLEQILGHAVASLFNDALGTGHSNTPSSAQHLLQLTKGERDRFYRRVVQRVASVMSSVNRHWRQLSSSAWRDPAPVGSFTRLRAWFFGSLRHLSDPPTSWLLTDAAVTREFFAPFTGPVSTFGKQAAGSAAILAAAPSSSRNSQGKSSGKQTRGSMGIGQNAVASLWPRGAMAWMRSLDLLSIRLFEPRDTLLLRSIPDCCPSLSTLRLYVTAMSWNSLQHILLAGGDPSGKISAAESSASKKQPHPIQTSPIPPSKPERGLRSLSLRGSIDLRGVTGSAHSSAASMAREAQLCLKSLESLDLDLVDDPVSASSSSITAMSVSSAASAAVDAAIDEAASQIVHNSRRALGASSVQQDDLDGLNGAEGSADAFASSSSSANNASILMDPVELRNRTVVASLYLLARIGHPGMTRLRVRVPVRVPDQLILQVIAACCGGIADNLQTIVPSGTGQFGAGRIGDSATDASETFCQLRELCLDRVVVPRGLLAFDSTLAGGTPARAHLEDSERGERWPPAAHVTRPHANAIAARNLDGGGRRRPLPPPAALTMNLSMPFLTVLCLSNSAVDDSGLVAVVQGRVAQLQVLNVSATAITDSGIRQCAAVWAEAAAAAVGASSLDSAGAAGDHSASPAIREIYLDEALVSAPAVDELLAAIGPLLEVLSLHGVRGGPAALVESVVRHCSGSGGRSPLSPLPCGSPLRRLDVFSATLWGRQIQGLGLGPRPVARLLRACPQLVDLVLDVDQCARWQDDDGDGAAGGGNADRRALDDTDADGDDDGAGDHGADPGAGDAGDRPGAPRSWRRWWLSRNGGGEVFGGAGENGTVDGAMWVAAAGEEWVEDELVLASGATTEPGHWGQPRQPHLHSEGEAADRWRRAARHLHDRLRRRFPRIVDDTRLSKENLLVGHRVVGLLWERERGWV
ncbi:hypothetical protein DFJ73DRAFT_150815 [Zopfochytrium polystomum]|nr:hypothetical protein DFJ73DRAFT_150815 [Zopfochytrium polystomum]